MFIEIYKFQHANIYFVYFQLIAVNAWIGFEMPLIIHPQKSVQYDQNIISMLNNKWKLTLSVN